MNNILKAWNAGFVRRWHTQPFLVDSDDRNSGHQHRCTILLLLLWPDSSRDSIIDTIRHDQGEVDSGDMARPAKQKNPEIRELLKDVEYTSIEQQGLNLCDPSELEIRRRKFVDLLDSYLWMLRNRPEIQHRFEWQGQLEQLVLEATELEVSDPFFRLMEEAQRFYS